MHSINVVKWLFVNRLLLLLVLINGIVVGELSFFLTVFMKYLTVFCYFGKVVFTCFEANCADRVPLLKLPVDE